MGIILVVFFYINFSYLFYLLLFFLFDYFYLMLELESLVKQTRKMARRDLSLVGRIILTGCFNSRVLDSEDIFIGNGLVVFPSPSSISLNICLLFEVFCDPNFEVDFLGGLHAHRGETHFELAVLEDCAVLDCPCFDCLSADVHFELELEGRPVGGGPHGETSQFNGHRGLKDDGVEFVRVAPSIHSFLCESSECSNSFSFLLLCYETYFLLFFLSF